MQTRPGGEKAGEAGASLQSWQHLPAPSWPRKGRSLPAACTWGLRLPRLLSLDDRIFPGDFVMLITKPVPSASSLPSPFPGVVAHTICLSSLSSPPHPPDRTTLLTFSLRVKAKC